MTSRWNPDAKGCLNRALRELEREKPYASPAPAPEPYSCGYGSIVMYCGIVRPASVPVNGRRAPVAGCHGFWTCTLAGFVAPLLATYWPIHEESVAAGMFCMLCSGQLRFARLLE